MKLACCCLATNAGVKDKVDLSKCDIVTNVCLGLSAGGNIRFPVMMSWISYVLFCALDSDQMAFHQENSGFSLVDPTLFLLKISGNK